MVLSSDRIVDLHFVGAAAATQCLPLYRYSSGERIDNITDWALELFRNHYSPHLTSPNGGRTQAQPLLNQEAEKNAGLSISKGSAADLPLLGEPKGAITKEDIFHYVYAVLHHPAYRKKYELNLKREFPRIPLYDNFWQWSKWGEELMKLHINYETVEPYALELREKSKPSNVIASKAKQSPGMENEIASSTPNAQGSASPRNDGKAKLKAIKESGIAQLDENTELHGIPQQAWEYKLGNRSALEWILDQYKEKKPSDPTIAEKFNTYKFSDYKEKVIDLLKRVCTVSVETMEIIEQMPEQ
jgi:predicted helicase